MLAHTLWMMQHAIGGHNMHRMSSLEQLYVGDWTCVDLVPCLAPVPALLSAPSIQNVGHAIILLANNRTHNPTWYTSNTWDSEKVVPGSLYE